MRQIANTFWLCALLLPGRLAASDSISMPVTTSAPAEVAAIAPETGVASYYHDKYQGRPTASGELFDTEKLTAAHRTLPFGTVVKVTHAATGRMVIVRINDRGPFIVGRVIDLSRAAARALQIEKAGLAQVQVEIVPPATPAQK